MLKIIKTPKVVLLIAVFILSTLFLTSFSVYLVHRNSVKSLKENLYRIVESEKQFIDVLAQQGMSESELIDIYLHSIQKHLSLGITGQFVIAKQENDSIYFLYNCNSTAKNTNQFTNRASTKSSILHALHNKSGVVEGIGFDGVSVYAAYIYISDFKWTIVTEISQKEIDDPFNEAFIFLLIITLVIIVLVSILYVSTIYPLIETIKESDKSFKLLFENSTDILLIYDKTGDIISVNDLACSQLQYSKEEFLNKNIFNIEKTITCIDIETHIQQVFQKGVVVYESEVLRSSGSLVSVEVYIKKIIYNGQQAVLCVARDISQRKMAEQKLIESERLYRFLTENTKDVVWIYDSFTNKYVYLSPSIINLRGYSVEEVSVLPFEASLVPETIVDIKKMMNNRIQWVLECKENADMFYRDEMEQLCKDGSTVWTETISKYYRNNQTGNVEIQGVTRDISERKRTRAELIINEARYRKAQRIGKVGNWEFNLQTFSVWASDEAKRLCNLPSDKSVFSLTEVRNSFSEWNVVYMALVDLIQNGGDCSFKIPINNLTSKGIIITEIIAEIIRDKSGKLKMITGVIQDITEYKNIEKELVEYQNILKHQNEEYIALNDDLNESYQKISAINQDLHKAKEKAEESDRLKSAFLANMSHEIRTPMNAIVGFTEMLILPHLTEAKKTRYATIIKERTYDLLRIMEDLLDVSKIEVGQMKIFETNTELSGLLNDLYEYYHQKLIKSDKKESLSLKLVIDKSFKKLVISIDRQRLKQIFTNLIDNAFKFTQAGIIEFGCRQDKDGSAVFFVHDTGVGIPLEKQTIVFDRFRQADESLTGRQFGGTGLGLSIVKGIIKLMNGTIWLDSTENVGTTFYFTIPFAINPQEDEFEVVKTVASEGRWKNKTVLIVEDDSANREYLKEVLSDTGLNLIFAEDGKNALEAFKDYPNLNLILMDIRLPDTNGLVLTAIIKKENARIPIIAQTAYASPIDIKECMDAGCNDYIAKPISYDNLIGLMDKYLSAKIKK